MKVRSLNLWNLLPNWPLGTQRSLQQMATYIIEPDHIDLSRLRQTADMAALIRSSKVIIEMKGGERIIGQIVGKTDGIADEFGEEHDGIKIETELDGIPY